MNKMKKIMMMALAAGLIATGFIYLSDVSLAQFKLPDMKDLKDLDKGMNLIESGQKLVDAAKPWPYPEERATGRVLAAKVAASFGGVWRGNPHAEAWNKYVNKIGRGLVPYCNRPDIKYRFAILNSEDINAYSCPGGYIYVTRGLLKALNNEAQLAGILGHEIGHVSQRHIEKEVKKQQVG